MPLDDHSVRLAAAADDAMSAADAVDHTRRLQVATAARRTQLEEDRARLAAELEVLRAKAATR